MNQFNGTTPDTLLEEATGRLRDTAVAELPPSLMTGTVEAIAKEATAIPQRQRARRIATSMAGLAATLVLTVAGVSVLILHGGTQVAFAQVLDNTKKSDSVVFLFSQGAGQTSGEEHKCFAQGEKMRVEHSSGIVMITDVRTKNCLYLDASNQTAGLYTVRQHAAGELATGVVEQLRDVRPTDAEPIGKELVDGKTADVFRVPGIKLFGVDSSKGEMRIWVDPESMLPWKIELRIGTTPLATLRELRWNSPVEPRLLSMATPEGYIAQPEEVFRKRLRPDTEARQRLTPNEAFRKWSGQSK